MEIVKEAHRRDQVGVRRNLCSVQGPGPNSHSHLASARWHSRDETHRAVL